VKKPWNLPDLPVYSLMTEIDGQINMNICTYVSAMSMNPKRYAIGVYYQTKTLQNIQNGAKIVLQLLAQNQWPVVRNFGQKSGLTFDKHDFLRRKNTGDTEHPHKYPYQCSRWHDFVVLKQALAYIELQTLWHQTAGDHELYLFDVLRHQTLLEETPLKVSDLRNNGLVRI
jgi:flavin reductase (DIM6/NTAB) family NADH-FMN oxidoreductase RutF